jgi:hypothetical protein
MWEIGELGKETDKLIPYDDDQKNLQNDNCSTGLESHFPDWRWIKGRYFFKKLKLIKFNLFGGIVRKFIQLVKYLGLVS